jgi:uncharacterized protein
MTIPKIEAPQKSIADSCRRYHIKKLSFFGSVLGDSFGPESDIDVLVEFEEGYVPGLALTRMQDELSLIFDGRRVDLVTAKFLNRRIREKVRQEAVTQYVQPVTQYVQR